MRFSPRARPAAVRGGRRRALDLRPAGHRRPRAGSSRAILAPPACASRPRGAGAVLGRSRPADDELMQPPAPPPASDRVVVGHHCRRGELAGVIKRCGRGGIVWSRRSRWPARLLPDRQAQGRFRPAVEQPDAVTRLSPLRHEIAAALHACRLVNTVEECASTSCDFLGIVSSGMPVAAAWFTTEAYAPDPRNTTSGGRTRGAAPPRVRIVGAYVPVRRAERRSRRMPTATALPGSRPAADDRPPTCATSWCPRTSGSDLSRGASRGPPARSTPPATRCSTPHDEMTGSCRRP